jgi:hypothetical protein
MQGEAVLETIAEVSVALAGFTGVVAAFGQRGGERWSVTNVFRFTAMLGASFSALFYALFPFLLHHLGFSEITIWRLGSAAVALELVLLVGGRLSPSLRKHFHEVMNEASRALAVFVLALVTVVTVTQVLNAVGNFPERSFGAYLVGIAYFLFIASLMFVRLVLPSFSSER